MKNKLIKFIEKNKIILILRALNKNDIINVASAAYDGGIRMVEVAFDASGKISDLETADIISELSLKFDDKIMVGAGTVLNEEQVILAKNSGAKYIVSPNTNMAVIKTTNNLGLISIPGALTPTEAEIAKESGADFVKLFPAGCFGSEYAKALMTPLSDIRFLAVGGIKVDEIRKYLECGIKGFGISSGIAPFELVKSGKFCEITALAKAFTSALDF